MSKGNKHLFPQKTFETKNYRTNKAKSLFAFFFFYSTIGKRKIKTPSL